MEMVMEGAEAGSQGRSRGCIQARLAVALLPGRGRPGGAGSGRGQPGCPHLFQALPDTRKNAPRNQGLNRGPWSLE